MARILIIDDNEMVRQLLKDLLKMAEYDVDVACNGEEGVQRFRENPADLIITDIKMPVKDGLETIREMKADYPDIKIIAISGDSVEDLDRMLNTAQELGADHIMTKPFDTFMMLKNVKGLLIS